MNNVNNNIDRISQEIQERFNRSRNIFLFGFPEYDSDDMTERNIIAMLNNMNINSNDIQIRRVGRINAGRPRLVIVTLHSRAEVLKVLRNCKALPPGVRANEDKTKTQRDQYNELKREVEEHNVNNPRELWRIKYINGSPKIVLASNPNIQPKNQ